MAAFAYTALDTRGKQRKGVLEADSIRQIRQLLRDQNLVPLDVDIAAERKAKSSGVFSMGRRIGALDRVLLTRQLATLIGAGLPIEEALQAVEIGAGQRQPSHPPARGQQELVIVKGLAIAVLGHPRLFLRVGVMFGLTIIAGILLLLFWPTPGA